MSIYPSLERFCNFVILKFTVQNLVPAQSQNAGGIFGIILSKLQFFVNKLNPTTTTRRPRTKTTTPKAETTTSGIEEAKSQPSDGDKDFQEIKNQLKMAMKGMMEEGIIMDNESMKVIEMAMEEAEKMTNMEASMEGGNEEMKENGEQKMMEGEKETAVEGENMSVDGEKISTEGNVADNGEKNEKVEVEKEAIDEGDGEKANVADNEVNSEDMVVKNEKETVEGENMPVDDEKVSTEANVADNEVNSEKDEKEVAEVEKEKAGNVVKSEESIVDKMPVSNAMEDVKESEEMSTTTQEPKTIVEKINDVFSTNVDINLSKSKDGSLKITSDTNNIESLTTPKNPIEKDPSDNIEVLIAADRLLQASHVSDA